MAMTKKPAQRYYVDRRVAIGLDALDDTQKMAVGEVIIDRDHFLAHAADRHKVETISKRGSMYALSVPAGLKIIYKVRGENIEVLDLMGEGFLRRYARKSPWQKDAGAAEAEGVGLAALFLHETV